MNFTFDTDELKDGAIRCKACNSSEYEVLTGTTWIVMCKNMLPHNKGSELHNGIAFDNCNDENEFYSNINRMR